MNDNRLVCRSGAVLPKQVLGKSTTWGSKFWRILLLGEHDKVRVYALPLLLIFGMVGVLIDLDHLIIGTLLRIRPLHVEYLACFWIVGICYLAYVYRCVHRHRIENDSKNMEIIDE